MPRQIAVVGAGVVGLSTAVQIQQVQPSALVTLIADKFTTETTSHGAAGFFRPTVDKFPGVSVPQLRLVLSDQKECGTFVPRHTYPLRKSLSRTSASLPNPDP